METELRVDSRLPSAVGTTISVTESHAQNTTPMIPPRCPVQFATWTKTLNTERFHKRDQQKREQHSTPYSEGLEHDPPDGLGCRMKFPKNAVGTLLVGMGPSCRSANRITGDLAAVIELIPKEEPEPAGCYCHRIGRSDMLTILMAELPPERT